MFSGIAGFAGFGDQVVGQIYNCNVDICTTLPATDANGNVLQCDTSYPDPDNNLQGDTLCYYVIPGSTQQAQQTATLVNTQASAATNALAAQLALQNTTAGAGAGAGSAASLAASTAGLGTNITTSAQLSALLTASGSTIIVAANSPALAVARANPGSFNATMLSNGTFQIKATDYTWMIVTGVGLVALLLLGSKK